MRALIAILAIALTPLFLVPVLPAVAKSKPPKSGLFTGKAESTVRSNADEPPLSFKFSKGKNGKAKLSKVDAFAPLECSGDGFDVPIHEVGTVQASAKANGKVSFTNNSVSLTELVNKGLLGSAPNGAVKVSFTGKISGKKAKGTFTVSSIDAINCTGQGKWEAEVRS